MMLQVIAYMIIGLYTLAMLYVTMYCLMQFHLLLKYSKGRNPGGNAVPSDDSGIFVFPAVTIQIPVFNERFVVERLIDNIVKLKYPGDKLQIQILDDSTDDTHEICISKVDEYKNQGIDILCLHRSIREGYKAGALRDGLSSATGEFIAIFDADFLPSEDFLLQTIPCFRDQSVGVVQTRWDHINTNYSMITMLQAFQLNVHFTIEQSGRQSGDYFLQFNGTAGIWRRRAIEESGGWEADTLTEDLDLSYRAQLKGWKILYRQDIASPAELPVEMNGLKSQQFRWMKGGAENARKLIPAIFRSHLTLSHKFQALSHLLSSSIFPVIFFLGVVSVPALFLTGVVSIDWRFYALFLMGLLTLASVYFVANSEIAWSHDPVYKRVFRFLVMFPVFLSLSSGLSLHNSIAVIQGYLGHKTAFVRTPKFNILKLHDTFRKGFYKSGRLSAITLLEGVMAIYFLLAVLIGLKLGKTSFLVYHLMLVIGFGSICIYSIRHLHIR